MEGKSAAASVAAGVFRAPLAGALEAVGLDDAALEVAALEVAALVVAALVVVVAAVLLGAAAVVRDAPPGALPLGTVFRSANGLAEGGKITRRATPSAALPSTPTFSTAWGWWWACSARSILAQAKYSALLGERAASSPVAWGQSSPHSNLLCCSRAPPCPRRVRQTDPPQRRK